MRADALPGAGLGRAARGRAAAASPLAWLVARLQVPLYRNGYALIASSGLTSALGLAYWLVAARTYSAAAVGVSAALISAMTLLADLSHLNLKSALNRFLPRAGAGTARFVTRSYLLALGVSALASIVFLAGLDIWSPKLSFLTERPELALWFVAATMAWTIFVLQDSVLAGIRQAAWVPAENLIFSVAKIVLLVALVAAAPTLGAFVSWSAPVLVLIVPVNLLLFRRLIPSHVRATRRREQWFPAWRVASYVAADYAAYAVWSGTVSVLPLVVLGVAGADATAYFFVSWAIAYSLYLVSSGMGMSLLAEASLDPARLGELTRRTLAETARIVVPAAALVVAGAPVLLGLLGEDYSGEAVTLLRLLALSAVPYVVVAAYVNVARVERRMRAVVAAYAALSGLVLALGLPLLASVGIEGLGMAWLVAQSTVAAGLGAGRLVRRSEPEWRRRTLGGLARARRLWLHQRRRVGMAGALRPVLEALRRQRGEEASWGVHEHVRVLNDVAVCVVGPRGAEPLAVVKRACTDAADAALARQERALLELGRHPALAGGRGLVPKLLAGGKVRGRAFVAETVLPGTAADALLLRGGLSADRFLAVAERAIRPLHQTARERVTVDERLLREWVDLPLARLRPVARERSRLARWELGLERLGGELRDALTGAKLATSWIHGDLCPSNVLIDGDGAVTGIVDWEQAGTRGIPRLDLLHLLITTRMVTDRKELGSVVAELLDGPLGKAHDRRSATSMRALLLLAWLRHVEGNLTKSTRYGRSRLWVRNNVDPVLASALRGPAPAGAPAALPVPGLPDRSAPSRPRARRTLATRLPAPAASRPWIRVAVPLGGLALGLALWLVSLGDIDPRAMSDIGLVSVLPPGFCLALVALTASYAMVAYRRPERPTLLIAHLVALVAILHATPAIVYGTLRYSWAWKHVGIVDYIQRHGGVATDIDYLGVYHNWPGFFGLDALLAQLAGLPDTVELAIWAPLFFNLLNLAALVFLFSGLTRDRQVVWLASWLFFVASWVGQDYFSPQAFAFFLYLVLLGVVVRWLGRDTRRAWAVVVSLLVVATIAASHPLTSVMVAVALAGLALLGVCAVRSLPFVAGAITVAWDLVLASDFVERNADSTLDSVTLPWTTTESSLTAVGQLSQGQALVATLSRGLTVAVVALALAGAVRQLRAGELNRAAAVLALAPLALFAAGDYGGEMLFRIYLFALPFVAFFAAQAFVGQAAGLRLSSRSALAFAGAATLLLGAFLFAYYGKERQYYFSPAEVAAAEYLYTHAPPGALLIEGTRNYPGQFKNYERFDYVPLSREPRTSHARFVSKPAAVFSDWMSDPAHSAAFLIITRSQKAEVDELGVMPPGSLDRIERALLASPLFEPVFRNRDATVLTLSGSAAKAAR